METGIASSLIPREPIVSMRGTRGGGMEDVLFFFAIITLVVSLGLAGAVYFYGQYLQTQVASKQQSLVGERNTLDQTTINHLIHLDAQLRDANTLLNSHLAPTVLFDALGKTTLQTVMYNGISYTASDPQHVSISMTGLAQSVNSVALQSELLASSNVVQNPIFSGISRQADGVHFTLSAEVNQSAIGYAQVVAAQSTANQQTSAQTQTTTQQPSPFGTANTAQ